MPPVSPQRDEFLEAIQELQKYSTMKVFQEVKVVNYSLFVIAICGDVSTSATFVVFVPDSTSVITLYFSESDNHFFKLAIFHNIQL